MVKVSKRKKTKADAVYAKKSDVNKPSGKLNPFEIHIDKEKFKILGRTCKHDKGLPGVSRGKQIKKRKETLGKEFKEKDKTNKFKDYRIGKNITNVENDDLMTVRFVAEKLSQMKEKKNSRFNLNDEILTHRGQTLEEIEEFCDERSDDDDESLNADFTQAVNFGSIDPKSRQTAIEDIIVKTKQKKAEIAKDKNEIFDLTTKLDKNYKDLMPLMGKSSKPDIKPRIDDYDKIVREMVFEPRGTVTDKLLSKDEIARQEKERLERLENERLARMKPDDETEAATAKKFSHRSADDLDDNYFANGNNEGEEEVLCYNIKGELIKSRNKSIPIGNISQIENNHNENDCENENEMGEEEEGSDEDSNEGENETSEEEHEDNLSDLKTSDSENEDKIIKTNIVAFEKTTNKSNMSLPSEKYQPNLPFTIDIPHSYNEFKELICKYQPKEQGTVVERIIKCNHPILDSNNKETITKFFSYLLQYINDLFNEVTSEDVVNSFEVLDQLNPHLFDLINFNQEKMSSCFLEFIKEKYNNFKINSKSYPPLQTLVFFKLISNLFSTSDFRHSIVTPCYVFIQQILSKSRVQSRQDFAMGLFLVTIILEFSQQSKRFLPAALNFLLGIIYLSIPKKSIEILKINPPFNSTGLFTIFESFQLESDSHTYLTSIDLVSTTITTDFKVRALNTTLNLIKETMTIIGDNIGSQYTAESFLKMMDRLDLKYYPEFVHKSFEEAKDIVVVVANKPFTKLVPPERKPKALRLLEPRIEKVYDDKRRPKMSAAKEERAKLLHKIKRETKGAIREIRRDTQFLQKIKIDQIIQSDMERKEKVKRIYQEASVQQGEINELARLKKRKKF